MIRIGIGYDLHRLEKGSGIYVGGVFIPCELSAVAHSDGDALIHSVIDALLSPLGVGDIGVLFPDTDPRFKGISSMELLSKVKEDFLKEVAIFNIDGVVIADRPKISAFIPDMKTKIARALDISPSQVGIKGKTSEGVKNSVIEAYCVALIDL
jgi:2-C-methyl-D-erythritol 2,4-cyclodiphosphate synthase